MSRTDSLTLMSFVAAASMHLNQHGCVLSTSLSVRARKHPLSKLLHIKNSLLSVSSERVLRVRVLDSYIPCRCNVHTLGVTLPRCRW